MEQHILINNIWSTIYSNQQANEIVIGVHGFAGDKESSVLIQLAHELNKKNIALITFDLPCHGENDNSKPLSLDECLSSIETIFNYAKTNYPNTPISVFATSFGGYLTLNYLAQHNEKLHKIILRAPAIRMHDILMDVILPEHNFSKKDLDLTINLGYATQLLVDSKFVLDLKNLNLDNQPETNNFIYILQGKQDNVVNANDNISFFQKHYPNKHKFIFFENADHRFKKPGELEKIVSDTLSILNID